MKRTREISAAEVRLRKQLNVLRRVERALETLPALDQIEVLELLREARREPEPPSVKPP